MTTAFVTFPSTHFAAVLLDAAVKSAVLLILTCTLVGLLRKASAAMKHAVLLAGLSVCLLLPLTSLIHPLFQIALPVSTVSPAPLPISDNFAIELASQNGDIRPADRLAEVRKQSFEPTASQATRAGSFSSPENPLAIAKHARFDFSTWIVFLWFVGCILVSGYWIIGRSASMYRLRGASPSHGSDSESLLDSLRTNAGIRTAVKLRISQTVAVPVVAGVIRPTIFLPTSAAQWPSELLRSVLLHELAHVRRGDCAAIWLTQVVSALYWFNPLTWIAIKRLRAEQDRACDDWVIRQSVAPADYAGDLLSIATRLRRASLLDGGTLAMARRSGLQLRVERILDGNANRRSLTRRWAVAAMMLAALSLLTISAVRLSAQPAETKTKPTSQPTTLPADWFSATKVNPTGTPFTLTVLEAGTNLPLENAKIDYFSSLSADVPFRGYTDAGGKLVVKMPTEASLVVQALGHVWRWVDFDKQKDQPAPPLYTVHLEKGITVGGRIIDDAGQPIAGAKVIVWGQFKPTAEKNERRYITKQPIVSDANGTWQIHEAPAEGVVLHIGAYDLNHLAADYTPMREFRDLSTLRDLSAVWTLPAGTPITGTVYGPSGKPIANADIAFGADQVPSNAIPYWHTDQNGHYSIAVKPGQQAVITASPHGYAPDLKAVRADSKPLVIDFHLDKASTISGTVVDAAGKPVPHASVYFDTWRGYRSNPHPDRTDDQGRFAWHNAPADTVYVNVDSRDLARQDMIPMKAGEEAHVVLQERLQVTGTVVDADTGQPVPQFHVVEGFGSADGPPQWFPNNNARDHEGGTFSYSPFTHYAVGYALRVEARGYAPVESRVFKDSEKVVSLEFKLHRAADSVLNVLNPDGSSAKGAEAGIVNRGQYGFLNDGTLPERNDMVRIKVEADGSLHVPPQSDGFRLMIVADRGYAELSAEQVRSGKPVTLTAWAAIDGVLKIGSGFGVGQNIVVYTEPSQTDEQGVRRTGFHYSTETDAAGHFHFDRVAGGKLTLGRQIRPIESGSNSAMTQSQTVSLAPGASITLSLGGDGRLVRGKFVVPPELAGRPDWRFEAAPVFPTKLIDGKGTVIYGKTYGFVVDDDGTFQIDDVVAGDYLVSVSACRRDPRGNFTVQPPLATGTIELKVPAMTGGRSDEPLDLPPSSMTLQAASPKQPSSQPN